MSVVVLVRAAAHTSSEEAAARLRPLVDDDVPVRVAGNNDSLTAAAAAVAPADVVVVAANVRPSPGFVRRLAATAADESTVATAAALAVDGEHVDAALVAERSLLLRPRTVRATFDCTLVRRTALDLAGPLDAGFGERCSALGLLHVLADDVVVSGAPATEPEDPVDTEQYRALPPRPPARLARALAWTQRVVEGLEVTIDARALQSRASGTEVQLLALVDALRRTGQVRLRVLVPDGEKPTEFDGLESLSHSDLPSRPRRTAIVHRPFQVSSAADLARLAHAGERLVVTHLDLILFHDAAYHASRDAWVGYRRLTSAALAAADMVVAISAEAGRDLLAEDLVDASRLRCIHLGVDHANFSGVVTSPAGMDALHGRPFLVQLGSDLRHKNRPFTIELLRELRALGWDGGLVLAGPRAAQGSSRPEEDALLAADPALARAVIRLDAVTGTERRWLYREAAAVAYPSTNEGFGLVPFEAAAAGTPALAAPVSALAELLAPEHALLVPWDARASALRVLPALTEGESRAGLVGGVGERGARLTWERAANALLEVYDEALARPARASVAAATAALEAEARRGHWEGLYWALRNEIGETGLALVGENGALPEDAQRSLAALTSRPWTRKPLLRALRLAGKLRRAR